MLRTNGFRFLPLLFLLLPISFIQAKGREYDYNQLRVLEQDDMEKQVRNLLKEAIRDPEDDEAPGRTDVNVITAALKLVFSRPDVDGMRDDLVKLVRTEVTDPIVYDRALEKLADSALNAVTNSSREVRYRSTDFVVLDNLLSEIQPSQKTNPIHRQIVKKMLDKKINVPDDIKQERQLRSMLAIVSPSERAKKMWDEILADDAKKEKKKESKK